MQTKIILAITAAALILATLAAVTAIQFAGAKNTLNPTQTATPYTNGAVPPYCYNNGTVSGYDQNGYGCYGYGAQGQYGFGMMGRSGYGMGRCW